MRSARRRREEEAHKRKCVEEKTRDENRNRRYDEGKDVSNRHMTWWRRAWWIQIDHGSSIRGARGRRRVWRAARRAAEEARDKDGVGTAQCHAERAKGQTGRRGTRERQARRCRENALHIVMHLFATEQRQLQQPQQHLQQCLYSRPQSSSECSAGVRSLLVYDACSARPEEVRFDQTRALVWSSHR